jgi:Tol biopolymer transport system component
MWLRVDFGRGRRSHETGNTCIAVRRLLVSLIVCLVAGGCAWTESGDKESSAPPAAHRIVYAKFLPGRHEIWIARVDGGGRRRLAKGRAPAISPDGRWVAFEGGREATFEPRFYRDVMLVASSGGQPRLLMRAAHAPVWSPDSKRVAVLQDLDDRRSALLSIEIETGQRTTVARGAIDGVSFSPRGDEVAYSRGEVFGKVNVYVADADGGGERRVTTDQQSAYPAWGPRDIAVARIVPYRGWGAHEIWLVRPDGSARRLLTKTPRSLLGQGIVGLIPLAWSADGHALLAALANEFGGIPYAVNPETGAVRRIGDYGYRAWPHGLSRDGRFVLVAQTSVGLPDRSRVDVVPYAGGSPRLIARRAGEASWNQ